MPKVSQVRRYTAIEGMLLCLVQRKMRFAVFSEMCAVVKTPPCSMNAVGIIPPCLYKRKRYGGGEGFGGLNVLCECEYDGNMKGFIIPIEKETFENEAYRRVLYTAGHAQLVLMSLLPGEEIGEEVHHLDQFIRIEEGSARIVLDGETHDLASDHAVVIPEGVRHNVMNIGEGKLKLYTIYTPPEHKDGLVMCTKAEADAAEEHFDGHTTE